MNTAAEEFEALKQEGNQCFREKHYPEALQIYSKALEKMADSVTYSNRAQTLLNLGRPAEAYADTVKALELDVTNQKACFRQSLALIGLKRYVQAVKCLEECLQLAPNSVEVKNLLKEAIQKSWNVKSPIKRKHGSDVAIDRIYAFPAADFRLVRVDSTEEIRLHSWLDLSNYLEQCHSKIRLVVFDGISLNRDAMEFFRAVNPICLSGEVHFNKIDFSPSAGLFEELFDGILTQVDVVQFVAPEGIRGYWFSEALCKFKGLRQANLVCLMKESTKLDVLSKGHKLDIDGVVRYLHNDEARQCRVLVADADFFRVSIKQIWEVLAKNFENSKEEVQYMLEIVCLSMPEMPAQVNYQDRDTKEQLSLVVDLHPLAGKILLNSGYRVLIRRFKEC